MNSSEVFWRTFNPIKECESCSVISPSWKEILGQLSKLVMGCNSPISSLNLKNFIDSLIVSCIWQINNHGTVTYALLPQSPLCKEIKENILPTQPLLPFSLLQAHPHPNPTGWVSLHSFFSTECLLLHSLQTSFLWTINDGNSIT